MRLKNHLNLLSQHYEYMNEIYPWQSEVWSRISADRARIPHALLLRGRSGIGKFDFAQQFAKSLLCHAPQQDRYACGVCTSCSWFEQNNHPDYRLLTPEQESANDEDSAPAAKKSAKKSQISVEQIRDLNGFLELSSHHGGGLRVALIHPAETLNASSANALLKMLEEPPAGVIFLLVSQQSQRLLPTIISRCQKIDMPVPQTDIALQWLESQGMESPAERLAYVGGSPLSVLKDAEDGMLPIDNAAKMLANGARLDPFLAAPLCLAQGMESALHMLQKWVYDLLAIRFTGSVHYHARYADALQVLSKSVDLVLLLDFQKKLNEARKSAAHPLNNELQMESLMLQYTQLFSTKSN